MDWPLDGFVVPSHERTTDRVGLGSSPPTQSGRGVRSLWLWGSGALVVTIILVWSTKVTGFGEQVWHYNVSFVVTTVAYLLYWRRFSRDRVLIGIPLVVTALLAIITGFYLLYSKEWLKAEGWKDVAKYWHSLVSWLLLLLTAGHFVVNGRPLIRYFRSLYARFAPGALFTLSWAVVIVVVWVSVLPGYRTSFTDANYLFISSWSILVSVAVGYVLWMAWKWRTGAWGRNGYVLTTLGAVPDRRTRGGLDRPFVRRHMDTHMLLWYLFAQGSGLVLLYSKDFLHGNGFKYVSKFWHTAPSAAVTVFIFAHTLLSWPLVAAYWRRWRARLTGARERVEIPAVTDDL